MAAGVSDRLWSIDDIDAADIYGDPRGNSETCLGRILGQHRKDIVLATKFARPMDGSGRLAGATTPEQVEENLRAAPNRRRQRPQAFEKHRSAILAREFEIALPCELTLGIGKNSAAPLAGFRGLADRRGAPIDVPSDRVTPSPALYP